MTPQTAAAGHVFVTRGDLTRLACDAWLLPTSRHLTVVDSWVRQLSAAQVRELREIQAALPEAWANGRLRLMPLQRSAIAGEPRPWLANVGSRNREPAWYVEGARQFLEIVALDLRRGRPLNGRDRHLVALPVVGTGRGGAKGFKGDILIALLDVLAEGAARHGSDIALVTYDAEMFAAAQWARRRVLASKHSSAATVGWTELSDALGQQACKLAERARAGNLVLFIGAGVSVGAGLPGWNSLLEALAQGAGISPAQVAQLRLVPNLDQARIIARRLEARGERIGEAVAALIHSTHCSLVHTLLAALPVAEAATLNYDTLFERACDGAGRPTAVLPYAPDPSKTRWLLKLHGCVEHPQDIVLTREDYLRYAERRAALAGIVQALLITRHMLFVGFSLADDNFHRIADDVRRALAQPSGRSTEAFGTALTLGHDLLQEELWQPDIRCIAMTDGEGNAAEARRLEIFLDLVLAEASDSAAHLLHPAFDALLSDGERRLRDLLLELQQAAGPDVRKTAAWQDVARCLSRLGGTPDAAGVERFERRSEERGTRR